MNTHDAHRIVLLTGHAGLTEIRIKFLQFFNVPYKMKQTLVAGGFIGSCLFHQHVQVSPSRLPGRHGGYIVVISALLVYPVQQLMDRQMPCLPPQPFHKE